MISRLSVAASLVALSLSPSWNTREQPGPDLLAGDPGRLVLENVTATRVQYRGRDAIRVVAKPGTTDTQVERIAIVPGVEFREGVIEADIAGVPAAGADTSARGFVGIAFRIDSSHTRYAAFYLRPTNGRATDQLRRNHSAQYIAHPDFPWSRLRKEQPGVYESYVDLEAGAWTPIRIELRSGVARLYVNRAPQPTLIVSDMKNPPTAGAVALWIDSGTEAHFSRLHVTP